MGIKNKLIPLADPKKQNFDVKLHSFLITRIGSNPRPLKRKSPLIITSPPSSVTLQSIILIIVVEI